MTIALIVMGVVLAALGLIYAMVCGNIHGRIKNSRGLSRHGRNLGLTLYGSAAFLIAALTCFYIAGTMAI